MTDLPRIARARAEAPYRIHIEWADGRKDGVDLQGVIEGFPPFAPLRDPGLFAQAAVTGFGSGIEWPNGLDYSAASLRHLAEAQAEMSGADFRRWQEEMHLSTRETADIFGVTANTVKNYRKRRRLPLAIKVACSALRNDRETFLALFRPRRAGRPRGPAA
jgi:hypothetical protein